MSEQEIKSLLYKDMQRFKVLNEKVNTLEKQVLMMHEHLTATTKQVMTIGEAIVKLVNELSGEKNDDTN